MCRRGRSSFTVAIALLAASTVFGQTTRAPRPGQPGKDVLWLPTPEPLVDVMLNLARVTARDVVFDLGSGDGRLAIAAAKRGATAIGIEYNADLVELSKRRAAAAGVRQRATFVRADFFQVDLSAATVVTLFLNDDLNLKLRPRLLKLTPGTRIVSNTFSMGDWEPDDIASVERGCANWCTALMWIVPRR
jgi:SAM-dependent methyltransferase